MKPETRRRLLTLWLPVTLAFVVVIAAWATLITIASKNPVEMIEVEKSTVEK